MTIGKSSRSFAQIAGAGTNYKYLPLDGFRFFSAQVIISGTSTVTVEATDDPDAVGSDADLAANLTWVDVTTDWFGVASLTSTGSFSRDTPCPWRAVRFKVVSIAGSTTDINATVMN